MLCSLSAIKVLVDTDLNTVYAGGVEMLGLHTTVAPRRPNTQAAPILEEYAFVPYMEANLMGNDAALQGYLHRCQEAARKIVESGMKDSLGDLGEIVLNGVKVHKESEVPEDGKCVLLKLLQEIGQLDKVKYAKEMIEANKDLQDDCLLSALINGPSFKCCIDVVRENLPGMKIKITEVAAEKGRLFKQITPQLLAEPQMQLEYVAAASSVNSSLDQSLLQELGVTEASWDWSEKPSNTVTNSNLVIANNVLSSQSSLSAAIEQLKNLVTGENGYLLIKECTHHLAVPAILDRLTTASNSVNQETRTFGAFCDVKRWREVFALNGLSLIAEKSDGLMSTMFLCKVISDPLEATVINCDSLMYEWIENLKEAVTAPGVQRLWLVSPDLNTGLVGMVNCLKQEPGGSKIR